MQPASSSVACSVILFFVPVALDLNSGLGRLTVEVLDRTQLHTYINTHTHTHTHTHTQSARLLRKSDQLIAEAATCTTQ